MNVIPFSFRSNKYMTRYLFFYGGIQRPYSDSNGVRVTLAVTDDRRAALATEGPMHASFTMVTF